MTLGLREVPEVGGEKILKSEMKVTEDSQPSPKRPKADKLCEKFVPDKGDADNRMKISSHREGKQVQQL